jgi:transcriptional regulator with XRE-family HTH domain
MEPHEGTATASRTDRAWSRKLYALRIGAGLSQRKLADLIGRSQRAIWLWEHGEGRPGPEDLLRLARQFGVSVEYLCDEEVPAPEHRHASGSRDRASAVDRDQAGV